MPYGIILLPEPPVAARLIAFAARATGNWATMMRIGPDRPPHVTLAHLDCGPDDAAELWHRVARRLPAAVPVKLSGIQYSRIASGDFYVPQGGVYCGLEAVRRAAIDDAHRELLAIAGQLGVPTIGGVGENFRPHVTLAVLTDAPGRVVLPDAELLDVLPCRLAFGELAPFGTFPDPVTVR